jgi:hypothetical protein
MAVAPNQAATQLNQTSRKAKTAVNPSSEPCYQTMSKCKPLASRFAFAREMTCSLTGKLRGFMR